jgi:hypothetical protein
MNFEWYRQNGFQLRLTPDNARYLYENDRIITHCAYEFCLNHAKFTGHAIGLSLEGGGEDD